MMMLSSIYTLCVLCVGCSGFTHSTTKLHINQRHQKGLITLRPTNEPLYCTSSACHSVDPSLRTHQESRHGDIKRKLSLPHTLTKIGNFFSRTFDRTPQWLRNIPRKCRFLLTLLFICSTMGVGHVKKADANTASVSKLATSRKRNLGEKESERFSKEDNKKKNVEVEFVISNTQKQIRGMKDSSSEAQIVATASAATRTPTPPSTPKQVILKKESSASKIKIPKSSKKQKSGSVVLKEEAQREFKRSLHGLADSLKGAKLDTLIMLMVTSTIIPVFKHLNLSPILGFLLMGTLLGPSCLGAIHDVHTIDVLGELGIVFFLFEMGLELSVARLNAMKKDVFGLGTSQFLVTAAVVSGVSMAFGLPTAAAVTIGGSLSLSSSAFVLQLLKDKDSMGTRHGKASFGILLLQDLAVVPLLVVVELLAKGGTGLGKALSIAGVKALFTLSVMGIAGKKLLNPIFYYVAKSRSHEAFLSIILTTVLLMSFVTQGIGLSNTLGAFLAGLLLAETKYKYQIEADIAPFRGLLLGFFFITVGFNIDLAMIVKEAPKISAMLASLIIGKAAIITTLSLAFGISFANSQLSGLLLAQGGEFAFVALGIAERSSLVDPALCKLLLTTVALSMAATPMLAEVGTIIAKKIEEGRGLTHYLGQDKDAKEMKSESKDFVLVAGYGRVGKMVCDMLDRLPVRYIALDGSPGKAIEARGKGLPVFYGDINRPEVLRNFDVGRARAVVFAIDDKAATNKAVINVRKMYPDLPLLVKAQDSQHKQRLEKMFDNIYVMAPVLPEDSVLLVLPFGGTVLRSLGMSKPEVDAILNDFRRQNFEENSFPDDTFDFLTSIRVNNAATPGKYTFDKKVSGEKKEKESRDKESYYDMYTKESSWDGTEEQERQEEEVEMHEYTRITRILNERNAVKEKASKASMNGMIGGAEDLLSESTDSPVSVYLDGELPLISLKGEVVPDLTVEPAEEHVKSR